MTKFSEEKQLKKEKENDYRIKLIGLLYMNDLFIKTPQRDDSDESYVSSSMQTESLSTPAIARPASADRLRQSLVKLNPDRKSWEPTTPEILNEFFLAIDKLEEQTLSQ